MTASKLHQFGDSNHDWLLISADRGFDTHDICLRSAAGSGHFRVSDVCNCGIASDYRRGADHFRQPNRARVDVDRIHYQFCRLFLTAVLSVALQPAHVGRRVVDHRGHPRRASPCRRACLNGSGLGGRCWAQWSFLALNGHRSAFGECRLLGGRADAVLFYWEVGATLCASDLSDRLGCVLINRVCWGPTKHFRPAAICVGVRLARAQATICCNEYPAAALRT